MLWGGSAVGSLLFLPGGGLCFVVLVVRFRCGGSSFVSGFAFAAGVFFFGFVGSPGGVCCFPCRSSASFFTSSFVRLDMVLVLVLFGIAGVVGWICSREIGARSGLVLLLVDLLAGRPAPAGRPPFCALFSVENMRHDPRALSPSMEQIGDTRSPIGQISAQIYLYPLLLTAPIGSGRQPRGAAPYRL